MRLTRVMQYALANGYTSVSSVLGVSRWKDLDQVNAAALHASEQTSCPYVLVEGRKNGMQQMRLSLIKELNLYNQNYCGCIYSQKNNQKQ
jgi:predicted adenine nucleotide alpha hydrolase (AANH) superfamily ATPase